jgi:6-phosphogluconolactonase
MPFEILKFATPQDLAEAAAADWLKELEKVPTSTQPYAVALSGGRIAGRFFDAVAAGAKARTSLFNSVHFFWGDERCVPPTDPESNFVLARDHLLTPLRIADHQIHRVQGEAPPELAAAAAEAELRELTPVDAGGQPVLDLVFLGLGEDGHVASLFPGEGEQALSNPAVFRPVIGPKAPPRRITLGYPAIAAARQVWVLASGEGKKDAFHKSFAPGAQTPFARVLRLRSQTRIFSDIKP